MVRFIYRIAPAEFYRNAEAVGWALVPAPHMFLVCKPTRERFNLREHGIGTYFPAMKMFFTNLSPRDPDDPRLIR